MKRESPCMHCTRVANPGRCENKNCAPWQTWFVSQWEAACSRLQQIFQQQEGA